MLLYFFNIRPPFPISPILHLILLVIVSFHDGSGFAGGNIIKVLRGERVGTLFHRDAHKWVPIEHVGVHEMAVAARDCSRRLQVPIRLL